MASLAKEIPKRVTFRESVTVVRFHSLNRTLKRDLFYKRTDFEQFEMDAYVEVLLQHRIEHRRNEKQQDSLIVTPGTSAPDLHQRRAGAAIAA